MISLDIRLLLGWSIASSKYAGRLVSFADYTTSLKCRGNRSMEKYVYTREVDVYGLMGVPFRSQGCRRRQPRKNSR